MSTEDELMKRWREKGLLSDSREAPENAPRKLEKSPPYVEPLAEVIVLPRPSQDDCALASIPLIRHWLFAPDGSKLNCREFKVRTRHQDEDIIQTIRIGDHFAEAGQGYGILKARHQRLLFALQELWQNQGGRLARVDGIRRGVVCASSWELEEILFGSHGGRQKRILRSLIQQLSSIPVSIDNYIGSDGNLTDLDLTGLISGAEFRGASRGSKSQLGFPWVEIYLSSVITRAFEQSAVKPLNLRVLGDLKGDVAALLYPKIDYYLATNSETEMRLDGLVEKLGLQNAQMNKPSYRRAKFQPVIEELNGKPLSKEGFVISAKLVPTADGRDHKLVATRKRQKH